MSSPRWGRTGLWVLPSVVAVCALMVLPGGTFLASSAHGGNAFSAAAGVAPSLAQATVGPLPFQGTGSVGTSFASSPSNPHEFSVPSLPSTSGSGSLSSLSARIPSSLSQTPWIHAITHPGSGLQPLTSLPNLNLLENGVPTVNGHVIPGYNAEPAPLGLADFGLGATTYSYNTSHFVGEVTFNSPPNATQPGAVGVIEPSSGGEHEGAVGSPNEFGIQLNTVATNISIPGSDQGFMWTQNVVNWNDTGIHFVDDTFNASVGSGFYMAPGTILSACNNNSEGVDTILSVYGGVLQCVGTTIPINPANYPITIELYNNATTNAANESQVTYGYRIIGTGLLLTGISDTVIFNNPTAAAGPAPNLPGFQVDGFGAPTGVLLSDAEIVVVGGIGGDNAVFRSLNGSIHLEYSHASSGGWKNIPSGYNFGGDTGETSTGIADYWVAATHTLEINQGPTMLYGLWNAEPQVSVASGDVHLAGTISPSFGFVFVSNTPPVTNPFASGAGQDNLSWLPTDNSGAFNTYLPPFGGAWTSTYYVQAFADGYQEFNGTVTSSQSAYAIAMTVASHHTLRAPLYMFSNAQASALASAIGASGAAPYVFSDLLLDVNFTFDHLNDYDYPSFEVVLSQSVSNPVFVNNSYLWTDNGTGALSNDYLWDSYGSVPSGLFATPAGVIYGGPYYTSNVEVYDGVGDHVTDQELFPLGSGGSGITLWQDKNAWVNSTFSEDGGAGVWVGDSIDATVANTYSLFGATGVTDIGSTGTHVTGLLAEEALGVEAESSHGATYSWLNATFGSIGIIAGNDYSIPYYYDIPGTTGLTVNDLNVTYGSLGANITFSDPTTITNVAVWDPSAESLGFQFDGDTGVAITNLVVNGSEAFNAWNVTGFTVTNAVIENDVDTLGAEVDMSTNVVLMNPLFSNEYTGVLGFYDTAVTVANSMAVNTFGGAVFEYVDGFTGTNLNSSESTFAYELDYATGASNVNGVNANADNIGLNVDWTSGATVENVVVSDTNCLTTNCAGVDFLGSTGGSISTVAATMALGARLFTESPNIATGNSVTSVTATDQSTGVELDSAPMNTVSGVTASANSIGVVVDPSNFASVSDVTATGVSVGVIVVESQYVTVSTVSATDMSIGVFSADSSWTNISGVTASNTTLSGPWDAGHPFGLPAVAAVVTVDDRLDSIQNVQATTYPAALYDANSYAPGVYNLNATGGEYAVILNDTSYGIFQQLGAFQDWQGVLIEEDASYNVITQSSFVDCTTYGVAIYYGYYNMVYENNLIGNNGAGASYSSAHIQAYSGYGDYNYFDGSRIGVDQGNYWSDWHTYNQYGNLAPYPIGDGNWDYYPLGGPEGTVGIYFYEEGLLSGVTWSVTLNGVTESTSNSWLVFWMFPGTYNFTVDNVTGYAATPANGSVAAVGGYLDEYVTFVQQHNVTVVETGLTAGTTWSVTIGGVTATGTDPTLTVALGSGTYGYQVSPVDGFVASPSSGSLTVGTSDYSLSVTFTRVLYAVVVTENGLSSGTAWSASILGNTQTSTGTSITFYEPNGSHTITIAAVSGYSASVPSVTLIVNGSATGASVTFSPNTTTSVVSSSTFNTWLAVAIAVAVIALVLGVLAVFLRRRRESPPAGGAPPSS